jgi:hypothetical protein
MKQLLKLLLLSFLIMAYSHGLARTTRILSDKSRDEAIQNLEGILSRKDTALISEFPYVVNPFFFEQPLLLKLRAPGGISDLDLLKAVGAQLLDELSGAFVRGSRRSLLMESGDLVKEGDELTRKVVAFGGVETKVTVLEIARGHFVLGLNNSRYHVDMASR